MPPIREIPEITIAAGALSAVVTGGPLLGVRSLRHDGVELLAVPEQLTSSYLVHGQRAGITLLHPWANRLGADTYSCEGVEARLEPHAQGVTRDGNGLAIHGLAVPGAWTLVEATPSSCRMSASFRELETFPFPHRVDALLELTPAGELSLLTELSALGERPVPVAFGWHPYFLCDRTRGCAIELVERTALELDARGIPTGAATRRPPERIVLAEQQLDDGFAGIADGAAWALETDERVLRVIHRGGYRCAQVFAPADAPVVSLEPMTAVTDALRSGTGLAFAKPGRPFSAHFAVQVRRR
jgi:galactose mutarotase-like enzyme